MAAIVLMLLGMITTSGVVWGQQIFNTTSVIQNTQGFPTPNGPDVRWAAIGDRPTTTALDYNGNGLRAQWQDVATNIGNIAGFRGPEVPDGFIEWQDFSAPGGDPRQYGGAQSLEYARFRFIFRNSVLPNPSNLASTRNEVMTLTSKGRVGINDTAPFAKLDVRQDPEENPETGLGVFSVMNNSQGIGPRGPVGTTSIQGLNTSRLDQGIPEDDRLAIGVQGAVDLDLDPGENEVDIEQVNIGVLGQAFDARRAYGVYGFAFSSGSEARPTPTSTPTFDTNFPINRWGGFFNGAVGSTGGLFEASDARLKKDVKNLESSLDLINRLNPRTYFFKNDKEFSAVSTEKGVLQYGLIAQELEQVLPTLVRSHRQFSIPVSGKKDGLPGLEYKMVNYMQLIPILIGAVKELSQQVDDLKAAATKGVQDADIESSLRVGSDQAAAFTISPNPNRGVFTVSFPMASKLAGCEVVVTDLTGKLIKRETLNGVRAELNISNQQSGVYLVSVWQNGKELASRRVIKQ